MEPSPPTPRPHLHRPPTFDGDKETDAKKEDIKQEAEKETAQTKTTKDNKTEKTADKNL